MHKTYHKIQSVFLRDPANKHKTFLMDQWTRPEFGYLATAPWIIEEKIDGTNIRVTWDAAAQTVVFGGRTNKAQIPKPLLKALKTIFSVDVLATHFPAFSFTLYGEGYGKGIQKVGKHYLDHNNSFCLFDVMFQTANGPMAFLDRSAIDDFAAIFGIARPHVIGEMTLLEAIELTKAGFESKLAKTPMIAEGIIARPVVELNDRLGERIITKIKHRDFE